uniref:Uncharacterized protein n=1 Tax=Rhizophagus irregularis (strain DAOM 181602 / DAOM 197198 / MUCL 43194) TaxID=747089 RepID=U9SY82_RHIID
MIVTTFSQVFRMSTEITTLGRKQECVLIDLRYSIKSLVLVFLGKPVNLKQCCCLVLHDSFDKVNQIECMHSNIVVKQISGKDYRKLSKNLFSKAIKSSTVQ